jgi:hypothetical protein
MGANGLQNSKNSMADFFRRLKAKVGPGKAIVATATKLATTFYIMVVNQQAFNPQALDEYQQIYKQKKINQLKRKLQLLEAS